MADASRKRVDRRAAILLTLTISACTSDSKSRLLAEIGPVAQVGSSWEATKSALDRRGFTCVIYGATNADCTRQRAYWMLATCVQRVRLTVGATRKITAVDVPKPACTGM